MLWGRGVEDIHWQSHNTAGGSNHIHSCTLQTRVIVYTIYTTQHEGLLPSAQVLPSFLYSRKSLCMEVSWKMISATALATIKSEHILGLGCLLLGQPLEPT